LFKVIFKRVNILNLINPDRKTCGQVKRIGRHPSVIAWTANNENEGALVDNW